jgi:hypothetical protein
LRFVWKGRWKDGEITVEAQTVKELEEAIKELNHSPPNQQPDNEVIPEIPSILGCTDAVRALMKTSWGKKAKSFIEIKKALEKNGLFFSKEALSSTLITLVKRNDLQRVKDNGIWMYSMNAQDSQDNQVLIPVNLE